MVTNTPKCFQDTMVIETGLSDFNKMSATDTKMYYTKQKPFIVHYRKRIESCQSYVINKMFCLKY